LRIAFSSNASLDGGSTPNLVGNIWVANADGSSATFSTRLTMPHSPACDQRDLVA
jgi:nicotinamide mononucleotide (NMN) deamidase PncC